MLTTPAELPKVKALAQRKSVREMKPAERWAAYFLYNADESAFARDLVDAIKEEEEAVKMAAEVMHEYTADEKRYYRLLSEMKYELDHFNHMAEAEERGIKIGEERGRAEERIAMANALRAAGVSEEIIEKACMDAGREDL
jgi:predicted RNA-binding protein with EMAP domain